MNCNKCGATVPAEAAFCPQCGAQLSSAGTAAGNRPAAAARLQPSATKGTVQSVQEEELWRGGYSPVAMTGAFIGAVLLIVAGMVVATFAGPRGWIAVLVGAIVVFGYLFLVLVYRRFTVRYRLTSQRLLREQGILSRVDDRILVVEIDDVTVRQGIFERMFGVGTIILETRDDTSPILTMNGIENPRQVADLIDEARRAERTRQGMYIVNA